MSDTRQLTITLPESVYHHLKLTAVICETTMEDYAALLIKSNTSKVEKLYKCPRCEEVRSPYQSELCNKCAAYDEWYDRSNRDD